MKCQHRIVYWSLRVVLVAMIFVMMGGHWLILQSVAWAKMIVDYSRYSSLRVALEQTFDGRHPCGMCKWIQKEKQSSKQQELQQAPVNYDFVFLDIRPFTFSDPPSFSIPGDDAFTYPARSDPPPVPPPRSSAVIS